VHRKAWMLFGSHSFVFWVWRYDICTMHKCRRVCKIVNYVRLDVYKNKCKWIIFIKKPSKNRRFFPGSLSEGLIYIWNLESGDHPYKDFAKSIYKPDMKYKYFNYPFIFWLHVLKIKYTNSQIFFLFFFPHFWQLKTFKITFAF